MRIDEKTIESQIVSHYLTSGDYNGLPFSRLASDLGADKKSLQEVVVPLVRAGRISLPSPYQTNPHVKLFHSPVEEQLMWFDEWQSRPICLYPTAVSVADSIDLSKYDDWPFSKFMVLAYPKGRPVAFLIDVLDSYQDDPRYEFRFSGFSGWVWTHDSSPDQLEGPDRTNLTFGLGYDDQGNRVVVVPLYRLDRLPGKQQRIWKEFLAKGPVTVSEDYVTAAIDGQPVTANSVYDAIVLEQVEINKLFELCGAHRRLFCGTPELGKASTAVRVHCKERLAGNVSLVRSSAEQDALSGHLMCQFAPIRGDDIARQVDQYRESVSASGSGYAGKPGSACYDAKGFHSSPIPN